MPRITGIRDGHRIITTVTGPASAITIDREHHPECPCATSERNTMTGTAPSPAAFTLQRWNWTTSQWDDRQTFPADDRAEGNAWDAVSSERASKTGPIRLLKDGQPILADDPATYYTDVE
jgi:hypothetical protein